MRSQQAKPGQMWFILPQLTLPVVFTISGKPDHVRMAGMSAWNVLGGEGRGREQPRMCLRRCSHLTPFPCSTLLLHNHSLPQFPPNKTTPGETTPVTSQNRPAQSRNVRTCNSEDSRIMVKPSSLTEIKLLNFFLPLFLPSVKPS